MWSYSYKPDCLEFRHIGWQIYCKSVHFCLNFIKNIACWQINGPTYVINSVIHKLLAIAKIKLYFAETLQLFLSVFKYCYKWIKTNAARIVIDKRILFGAADRIWTKFCRRLDIGNVITADYGNIECWARLCVVDSAIPIDFNSSMIIRSSAH